MVFLQSFLILILMNLYVIKLIYLILFDGQQSILISLAKWNVNYSVITKTNSKLTKY